MFANILKWTFKVAVKGIEKEYNIHLDADSPIEAVEQVAVQMIAHCAKVKEAEAQQKAAEEAAKVAEPASAPIVEHVPEHSVQE